MTMVLPETLFLHGGYETFGHGGGCAGGGGSKDCSGFMRLIQGHDISVADEACLGSSGYKQFNNHIRRDYSNDNHMADQEESSSKDINSNPIRNTNNNADDQNQEDMMRDEGWLRLSIGGHTETKREDHHTHLHQHQEVVQIDPTARRDRLLELNLFSGGSSSTNQQEKPLMSLNPNMFHSPSMATNFRSSLFQHNNQQAGSSMMFPRYEDVLIGSWGFRPSFVPQNAQAVSSFSSSSSLLPFMGSYNGRPFQTQLIKTSSYGDVTAGPSSDFRVIDPPRRPHSGIWFVLQASQNQAKEPFLPPIPKSYLRIKDGKITIQLVMKYLANKLQLESESEIEIRCRGQELQPYMTLQHVRDTIWSQRDSSRLIPLLPQTSTSEHVMLLHYGRTP